MTKLLIIEDKALAGADIHLDWSAFNIKVNRVDKNGLQALEFIEKNTPEIVIMDIFMPQIDGLELMKISSERFGILPIFIIITAHKDFYALKNCMQYHVIDYLIRSELKPDILSDSINKALNFVKQTKKYNTALSLPSIAIMDALYDKFFIKLFLNLFENEEQIYLQANELNLNFYASCFAVCQCEIVEFTPMSKTCDKIKILEIYYNILHIIRENSEKCSLCYVLPLDIRHFSIIFFIDKNEEKNYRKLIKNILTSTFSTVHNYYNVSILASIGRICHNLNTISEAYQDTKQIFPSVSLDTPIIFYDDIIIDNSTQNILNMSLFKDDIKKAFNEFDTDNLSYIFEQVTDIISTHPAHFLQSIDAACNILFLSISLLPNGEAIVSDIFKEDPFGYRSVYKQTDVSQVVNWLLFFRDGLCNALKNQCKTLKNPIVTNVKRYIALHIEEKLTLPAVASIYGISANYLSNLFKKYNDIGFSEYITQLKIQKAKHLMVNSNMKIYEIADKMGFESAFYFSKVFKKVEGISPRDYMQT
jgi:two-component system response regulator YesN